MSLLRKGLLSVMVLAIVAGGAMAANVTFQVNMGFQMSLGNFDPAVNEAVVRGDFNDWSGNDWALADDDADSIYTGTFEVADGDYEYKFVNADPANGDNDVWENVDNRQLGVAGEDITLDVVWFDNQEPQETTDLEILFSVDMEIAIIQELFDPATDMVVVRGNNDAIGNWGGAVELFNDEGDVYAAWIEFDGVVIGSTIEYKFVVLTNGDPDNAVWESADNRTYVPTGEEEDSDDNGYGEYIPETAYFSNVGPGDILTQDLTVRFQVNCTPAYYKIAAEGAIYDVQDSTEVTDFTFVAVSGAAPLTWDWGSIPAEHMAYDDGANGDVTAGDSVFSRDIEYTAGDPISQEYKYGTEGYDTEAGFAMNHNVTFQDNGGVFEVYDVYGSQDTLYAGYPADVDEANATIPASFTLEQNFPNPFNPTTQIAFNLNERATVMVKVFNVNGQEVFSHRADNLNAGRHSITFDAGDLSSGVYFYQVQADGKIATRRMTLLK